MASCDEATMAAIRASFDCDRSFSFQLAMPATLMARIPPPWTPAQTHGCSHAPGWLYTSSGDSTPTMP